jgi:hypothetical protein
MSLWRFTHDADEDMKTSTFYSDLPTPLLSAEHHPLLLDDFVHGRS